MKKLIYTNIDGTVSIVCPVDKKTIEEILGPLTDEEYINHVIERSVPIDALNVREIEDSDIPTREFRNAWCDVTELSSVDINCAIARDIQLAKLRVERNAELVKTDGLLMRAMELEDAKKIEELKAQRAALRDATEPLKALDATGKVNCEDTLAQIRAAGILPQ